MTNNHMPRWGYNKDSYDNNKKGLVEIIPFYVKNGNGTKVGSRPDSWFLAKNKYELD